MSGTRTMRGIFGFAALLALPAQLIAADYKGPPAVPVAAGSFVRAEQDMAGQPAAGPWWRSFNDPVLDDLIARALSANPDIAIAEARIRSARSTLKIERAATKPGINAQTSTIQAHLPGVDLGQSNNGAANGNDDYFDFYSAGFDASWEIDLFGGGRAKIAAARAGLAAVQADAAAARMSLSADVAMAYIGYRDLQRRIALARQSSDLQHGSLKLIEQRHGRGASSTGDLERARAEAAFGDADLLPLLGEADRHRNALAVLTGAAPGSLDALLSPVAPLPLPPAAVAVGDPTALIARRPDIRAAERRLAMEYSRIGVAKAARLPRIRLLGLIGLGGASPADLVDLDSFAALAAPTLQWNLIDFGRGKAGVRRAEAARDEAEAQYSKTVLNALRDAEDSLARFSRRRQMVASLARAQAAAGRAADFAQQRYTAGTGTLIDANEAARRRIDADQKLATASAGLSMDFVAIEKALGLGLADEK